LASCANMPSGASAQGAPRSVECPSGTVALTDTPIVALYFDNNTNVTQAEVLPTVPGRCISPIQENIAQACAAGTCPKTVAGKQYCVPKPPANC
jgi:hypothetical protein